MVVLTQQEFQFLQGLFNDMFQSAQLRTGPMGDMVTAIRNKLLVFGPVDLTDSEQRFALFSVNDVFVSSHTPVFQPELGNAVRVLGSEERRLVYEQSEINQPQGSQFSGSYATAWAVMQSVMKKLGQQDPKPYQPLATGPTGDPGGVTGIVQTDPDDRTTNFGF